MRKSKFSETQIVGILKDAESGVPVADLLRKYGVSKSHLLQVAQQVWRRVGVGREAAAGARGRERQAQADVRGPGARERRDQGRPQPKAVGPFAKRQIVEVLVGDHHLSVQRACRVMRLSRAAYYRPPVPASRRDAAVIATLSDAVARYPRWGFWKLFDGLRLAGCRWNHKRVYRVYCVLRLNLPRRTTRRVPRRVRQPLAAPPVLNRTWALDFMTETLYDARRRVIRVLDELVAIHGCPAAFRVDNGPEFTAQTFIDWCAEHGAAIHYIQPGKPDQNAYIERFNRTYRTEVLNAHLFESVAELRALTDTWLRIYNGERPHDSLGRVPPLRFLPRPSSAGQSLLAVST